MTDAKAWLDRVRELEGRGELLLAYDVAQQGLEEHPGDVWLAHRAVLNLAKSGATHRADAEFKRLGLQHSKETDVAALGARIAKDNALAASDAKRAALLHRAAALYKAVYLRTRHYYPGINAATLLLLAGERESARGLAKELQAMLHTTAETQEEAYYLAATEAEASLILGDEAAARTALARATGAGSDLAARATTRRQLRLICDASGLDAAVLELLAPPAVICYTGHIISAPGGSGRLPALQEGEVAAAIKAMLHERKVGFGYGALAAGSDILFAEALLERGAELHVVLPFTREEFVEVSVAPAQAQWRQRFESCLERAHTVTYATDGEYLGHDWIFAYGSLVAMGLAVLRARFLDAEVRQAAVWDGEETTGVAGTGFDVRTWRELGRATDIISCKDKRAKPPARAATPPPSRGERELRAMLFGDVKGFSKLTEAQIPGFTTHILGAVGKVLERYGENVLYRNTWGDGLYVVLGDAASAARCALELQAAMRDIDLKACGLPETLAFRLGGHFGPVFETIDPVLRARSYMGAHVSRTARIEPVTPPGEVYVTEQFAARLALELDGYACNYVGQVPAAKDFGTMRMYHLHDSVHAAKPGGARQS